MKRTSIKISEKRALDAYSNSAYYTTNKLLTAKYSPNTAMFFSNLVDKYKYFESRNMLTPDGYFYLKLEDQMKALGLGIKAVRTAKRVLTAAGIISTKMKGIPPKEYYQIHIYTLLKILDEYEYSMEVEDEIPIPTPSATNIPIPSATNIPTPSATNINKENKLKENKNKTPINPLFGKDKKIQPEQFEEFWKIYPNKKGKGAAQKSWDKLCRSKTAPEWVVIRRAIREQKQTRQWKEEDGKYIPHPATWLNQSRFLDEVTDRDKTPTSKNSSKVSDKIYIQKGYQVTAKSTKIKLDVHNQLAELKKKENEK